MQALSFRNFTSKDYFTQLIIIQDLETYHTKTVSPLFSALLPEVHAEDMLLGNTRSTMPDYLPSANFHPAGKN